MGLKYWAYIFLAPGFNGKPTVSKTNDCTFKSVGLDFSDKEKVVQVAKDLVADGVQMIELCGGFGPNWVTKISEATENKIPVGSVMYGPEFRKTLLDILTK